MTMIQMSLIICSEIIYTLLLLLHPLIFSFTEMTKFLVKIVFISGLRSAFTGKVVKAIIASTDSGRATPAIARIVIIVTVNHARKLVNIMKPSRVITFPDVSFDLNENDFLVKVFIIAIYETIRTVNIRVLYDRYKYE